METDSIELAGRELPKNMNIGGAETTQLVHCDVERHIPVFERPRPGILVVPLEWWLVLRQDHTQPKSEHEIRVGEVLQHLDNGPFAGCLRQPKHSLIDLANSFGNPGHQLAQYVDWIPATEHIDQRSRVGGCSRGCRWTGRVGERHVGRLTGSPWRRHRSRSDTDWPLRAGTRPP